LFYIKKATDENTQTSNNDSTQRNPAYDNLLLFEGNPAKGGLRSKINY